MEHTRQYIAPGTRAQNTKKPTPVSFEEMTGRFLQYSRQSWWECRSSLPVFHRTFSRQEQLSNEKYIDSMVIGLIQECRNAPISAVEKEEWKQRLAPGLKQFAMKIFNLEQAHIDLIQTSGILEAMEDFCRKAREFDPQICVDDIYQAGRNIVTANLIQLLLGLPVRVTPSLFAYSMLYPYSDNYLDNQAIPDGTKMNFNRRFLQRLQGEKISMANAHEEAIAKLITMIEDEWDRELFPQVYDSLFAIYHAQAKSLNLVERGLSPFERDILGISFLKGGTSVLADGYLAAGSLSMDQAKALFGFGTFTQLMDDAEDIEDDIEDQRASLFTVTSRKWQLDGLYNRFCHYGKRVMADLTAFHGKDVALISELMSTCIDPILLNTVACSDVFYSHGYTKELETHFPVSFSSLNKQRGKMSRQNLDVAGLMNTFLM